MKLLLDSCTFLWLISGDPQLPEDLVEFLCAPTHHVWLSTVSNWEISIKVGLGKMKLPEPPDTYLPRQRMRHQVGSLPPDEGALSHLLRLPDYHRDPFDRMLICQAIDNEMTLVTPDPSIRQYPVKTLWS